LVGGGNEGFDGAASMSGGAVGGSAARFFGVEARGSRFAYIVDISGSMNDQRMSALKREVIASIAGLLDHAKFTVVTYNSRAESLTGSRWFVADERSKRETGSEIGGLVSSGGTEPSHAFAMVSRMRPKADAIYFMTDGNIAGDEQGKLVRRINLMNRSSGVRTRVHCITFMNKDSEKFMRRIARMTGGTYTHVGGGGQ
jgi:predicted metal-dependent peptidase